MSINVVIGAGGGTGLECVKRLLASTAEPCRAVVRNPASYADSFPTDPRLEVVAGDVTSKESLQQCLAGAKGVIFAASGKGYRSAAEVDNQVPHSTARRGAGGPVLAALPSRPAAPGSAPRSALTPGLPAARAQGVRNVAEVAKEVGAARVVLVSSALVHPANRCAAARRRLPGCTRAGCRPGPPGSGRRPGG
jgi:nucleoside-diphosphate-sugar epimerase